MTPSELALMAKDVGIALELARPRRTLPAAVDPGSASCGRRPRAKQSRDASISEMVRRLEHTTGTQIAKKPAS